MILPQELQSILDSLYKIGAKPILVGGCVRDHFLNLALKDYDIEVYDIKDFDTLALHLEAFGDVKLVGKSFGVLKLHTKCDEYDFALPRLEKKVGQGHKGFEVTTNPYLDFEQAALRRDFTINAIGYNPKENSFLDPFDGIAHLQQHLLIHIDDNTFQEDPLRIYRAIQFSARFDFELDLGTKNLCREMIAQQEFIDLPKERIFEEFKKFLLQASKPSKAFELMKELELLHLYPQLQSLIGCEQEYEYHPEGDVWVHTLMCMDEMAKILKEKNLNQEDKLILMLAVLCHDFGKPLTTMIRDGKITSHKHEKEGVAPTLDFLNRLSNEKKLMEEVSPLVQYHLAPFQLYLQDSSLKAVKRLAMKVNIEKLCLVALADCKGRTIANKEKCDKAVAWLLQKAKSLNVHNEPLKPLVLGRDLIALGLRPGKAFKSILEAAYEVQLDNEHYSKEEILTAIKPLLMDK